ncbi:glycosyl hydrolase [Novipirellula artificiosorum]|uniref:Beta-xylosidase n=1 Tax=Novipirellula artificiosorum TaxID=2528016 RepID=A0A5C6D8R3_9BACT|nr:glycosyl hydrolase [Novipirellula artificiosorum]TWU33188.1 Beta-xylosidase [Novipirellula artificiosorum]
MMNKLGLISPHKIISLLAAILFILFITSDCWANTALQNQLYENFKTPPAEARPFVRWWWNGNKITAKELDRELELLKRAGFGGVEINPIAMPSECPDNGDEALVWMSDEWIDLLVHSCEKAKELGLITDMIVGTGWPFGGEFLELDDTCQRVTPHAQRYKGGTTLELSEAELLATYKTTEKADLAGSHASDNSTHTLSYLTLVPVKCDGAEEVIDLRDHMDEQGRVSYQINQAGEYNLCYGFLEQRFRNVTLGAPGGAGPVMDHYKKEVTRAYLSRLKRISEKSGIPLNQLVRALFCDSIEISGANWSDGFADLFSQKYGYELAPWMPFIFDGPEVGEYTAKFTPEFKQQMKRVRYDYNKLLVETFLANFTREFQDFCTENDLLCRYQAYGTPFLMGMLDGYMIPDIPESNNWIYSADMKGPQWEWSQQHGYMTWNMYAASGGHLEGRKIISTEAMTNLKGVFKTTLEEIKQHDDMNFITGMNHSVLHGFNYSPPDVAFPGWIRFGAFFSELNPWWKHLSRWADYNARLSFVFQNSQPLKKIAIIGPTADLWGDVGLSRDPFHMTPEYLNKLWEPISQLGYSCDYINQRILEEATVKDGAIAYGPMRYDLLVLASMQSISPRAAAAVQAFAEAGGEIVAIDQLPMKSLQFKDHAKNDQLVKNAMERLLAEHPASVTQVKQPKSLDLLYDWTRTMLEKAGVSPDVAIDQPSQKVYQIHQRAEGKQIYFFANVHRAEEATFAATFPVEGKYPWSWNPETGERTPYPFTSDPNQLRITLEPLQSLLLVFEEEKPQAKAAPVERVLKQSKAVKGSWTVTGNRVDGKTFTWNVDQLIDFGHSSEATQRTFGGTLIYNTTLKDTEGFTHLDLGKVNEGVTELYVNGIKAGTRWYGEAVYPIADLLKDGSNDIEIHYTTVLANYCKSLTHNPVAQRWTEEFSNPTATGLEGPLRLLTISLETTQSKPSTPTQDERIDIAVDTDQEMGEFYNFWNVFPVTVQKTFLDQANHAELREMYKYADYINCVRFLGGIKLEKDDYYRGVDEQGQAICDFSLAIDLIAGIRECGFTPWIVLDNVPAKMCDKPTKNRYGNSMPPNNFEVWSSYIKQLVQALVSEFGYDEVKTWRFRVGTEPDLLDQHWSGTKEQYLAHYDHTVAAVTSIIPEAIIGPGNILDPAKKWKWNTWGSEIIDHCATGTNYVTGKIGTPMHFFSTSYYTSVGKPDERFNQVINEMRQKLKQYPSFYQVPVEIQEFGILSENGKWIVGDGTEFGGSWMAHFADKINTLQVPRVYQWEWNANKGKGIDTPISHVMDRLEEMVGGIRFQSTATRSSEADHVGCIAIAKEGHLDVMVFRHLAVRDNGDRVPVRVLLQGETIKARQWSISEASVINGDHPGFMHEQKADIRQAGKREIESLIQKNKAKYERMSELSRMNPPAFKKGSAGQLYFDLELDGHSVVLLRLKPRD